MHQTSIFVKFFSCTRFLHILEINILNAQFRVLYFGHYALFYCDDNFASELAFAFFLLISCGFQSHFVNYSRPEFPLDSFRQSTLCR